jgi:hypothetical protein
MRPTSIAAVVFWCGLVSGCGHNIGDNCSTNVDCQPDGTRFCDTSAINGYCTIDGCDDGTCPDEAVCIRFLTQVPDEPCSYDAAHPNSRSDCPRVDDRCVCDATVKSVCQGSAHCAPEASERRWCQLKCSSNGDCRTDYECRSTGTFGAEPVPTLTNASGTPAKFCAPMAPPPQSDLGP